MRTARKHELTLPQYWTPEQALAAFEMIDLLRDRLWRLYGVDIQKAMRNDQQLVDPVSYPSRSTRSAVLNQQQDPLAGLSAAPMTPRQLVAVPRSH